MGRIDGCIEIGQFALIAVQALGIAWLGRTLWWSTKKLAKHVRAPFSLRRRSAIAALTGVVGVWSFYDFLVPVASTHWQWASLGLCIGAFALATYCWFSFPVLATRAVRAAHRAPEFDRLWVYGHFARAFRPRVEPLLANLQDRAGAAR